MFNHDRSMHRGAERQKKMEEVSKLRFDLEDEAGRDGVETYLPMLILLHLKSPALTEEFVLPLGDVGDKIRKFFFDVVLVEFANFACCEQERKLMIVSLLEKIISGIHSPIDLDYARIESEDPDSAYPPEISE